MKIAHFYVDFRKTDRKTLIAKIIIILLIVLNLAFIWNNSLKTASDSNEKSKSITQIVAPHVVDDYEELPQKEKEKAEKKLNEKIRSSAHSLEFVPLGVLSVLLACVLFDVKRNKNFINMIFVFGFGALFSLLCALSDEILQIFVDGRAFELKDIGLDMCGALLGFAIIKIILLPFGFKRQKNYKKYLKN